MSCLNVAVENVGFRQKYRREKKEQVDAILLCLRNDVVTGCAGNVLPELPHIGEQDAACFRKRLPEPLLSLPGSRNGCSWVIHPMCVVHSCRHGPFRWFHRMVGSNLAAMKAIVFVKLLCEKWFNFSHSFSVVFANSGWTFPSSSVTASFVKHTSRTSNCYFLNFFPYFF